MSGSLVDVGLLATAVSVGLGGSVAVGAAVGSIAVIAPLLQAERITINTNRVREIFFKSFPPMSDLYRICTNTISRLYSRRQERILPGLNLHVMTPSR
jgi:hypothetical protein